MKRSDFSYLSANGTISIHGCIWEPDTPPLGIIQIAHGITEHMGRYEEFAQYFTALGYVVAGNDHLGHGRSLDPENPMPMYFGPRGSWQYVLDDIRICNCMLKERYPGIFLCLLGFSLGSFAVRCLLGDAPELADLTIWAGTGKMKAPEVAIARAVANLEARRYGDTRDTPLLHKMTMDTYNQRFRPCRTAADWICGTPEAVDDYLADTLCGEGFTVSSFRALLDGMTISDRDAQVAKMNRAMPVLLLSGSDDPVGKFGKGPREVLEQLKKHQFRDVSLQIFDGMRHDIFREAGRAQVFSCIKNWLNVR